MRAGPAGSSAPGAVGRCAQGALLWNPAGSALTLAVTSYGGVPAIPGSSAQRTEPPGRLASSRTRTSRIVGEATTEPADHAPPRPLGHLSINAPQSIDRTSLWLRGGAGWRGGAGRGHTGWGLGGAFLSRQSGGGEGRDGTGSGKK